MRPGRVHVLRTAALSLAVAVLVGAPVATAANPPTRTLVPIGSDYQPDTLQLFAREAAMQDADGRVAILVMPITYSLNAYATKNGERNQNTSLALTRTGQVQDACNAVKAAGQACDAQLVPVLIRDDAYLASNLAFFDQAVDGIYVLGGDQTVAMQVVAGTPIEARMAAAYAAGTVVAGSSAGDAVQSRNMINGFNPGYGPAESMRKGAVDVWTWDGTATDLTRGLVFGFPRTIMDQHVFEYGRTGRSLNVALETGLPVLGMDAATGAVVKNETGLSSVTGDTSGYVIDPVTWGATGTWKGPNATLSTRRIAMSFVAPGGFGFDLASMRPTVDGSAYPAPPIGGRSYPAFWTPPGSAPLLLAGGIAGDPAGGVGQRFLALAGGARAKVVVLATGYAKNADAQADAKAIAAALQVGVTASVTWFVVDDKADASSVAAAVSGASGILLTSPDRSRFLGAFAGQPTVMRAVEARWSSGKAVLLADNAAAAAMGPTFIADGISSDVEASAPVDLLADGVTVAGGLGWVGSLTVEPRLLPDQNWAQLFQLDRARQEALAIGVDEGTALEVAGGMATVRGASAAVVVDGRKATFATGTNGSLAARWLVIDSFADGETLAP